MVGSAIDAFEGMFGGSSRAREVEDDECADGSLGLEEKEGDAAGHLARTQGADGSFGGDIGRTAAALLVLVLLGHTRRKGLRRRTVLKAAKWLSAHRGDSVADLALAALAAAEKGVEPQTAGDLRPLCNGTAEGQLLEEML